MVLTAKLSATFYQHCLSPDGAEDINFFTSDQSGWNSMSTQEVVCPRCGSGMLITEHHRLKKFNSLEITKNYKYFISLYY
jgi:ribosomal protein S27AE|tara:strand:- start:560 stop:799 length:240 start_codon:yes stop_codon:yes gene_type:complete